MEDILLALQMFTLITGVNAPEPAPEGYCLDVRCECGSSYTGFANITVVTDLPIRTTAICANGDFLMDVIDSINHVVAAHYTTDADACVFFRRARTRTYVIYIHVTWMNEGVDYQQIQDHYTVSCAFNSLGTHETSSHTVHDSHLASLELQTNVGPVSDSEISLQFADLFGLEIADNSDLPVMKTVRLIAETDGAGGEEGIQVISCDGVGSNENGMRYPFLRAGCGDGLLIPKSAGFVTSGLIAVSAPFPMFHVHKDNVVKVICNVTLCSASCDGSSCANARRRRENNFSEELQTMIIRVLESPSVNIEWKQPDDVLIIRTERRILVTIVTCVALVIINLVIAKCLYSLITLHEG